MTRMHSLTARRSLAVAILAAACVARVTSSTSLGAQTPRAGADLSALQQRVDRLEAVTGRVEALSAIKRLQHAYGHYSELGLWHDFADLFADTGIGYYTQGALDREGIRTLFLKEVGGGRLGLADGRIYPHISMQPVVTLAADGQTAKGRWHIMAMLGGYERSASWAGGVYENQYVRENGVWKMKEVRYIPQYSGRYEDPGWTAANQPAPFHFEASRVGKPILDPPSPGSPTPDPRSPLSIDTLAKRMSDLAVRAQRLSDEIEITNLQHEYGYYIDRKMWDEVANLFAVNGTMEIGLQGVYEGRASIRRGLGPAGLAEGEVNDHIHLQTIVTVSPDGRSARARGTDLGMTATAGRALWSQSIYENEFVKQGGAWKVKAMHVYPRFVVDAGTGWAKDAQRTPGPSRDVPPDRPPTETYEIYPRFHIAPLHFDHPVTGRPPQYPLGAVASAKAAEGTKAAPRPPVSPGAAPAPVRGADALAALVAATELSIERSQAYHASENLATAYGYYSDEFAWDDAAAIFSRDGWQTLSETGTSVGREQIRQSLKLRYPGGKPPNVLALHQVVQPVIHVSANGQRARIRARLFQLGGPAGGEGSWTSGIYENTSVIEDGTWTLSGMDLEYVWSAPSRGGWARVTRAAQTTSSARPASR